MPLSERIKKATTRTQPKGSFARFTSQATRAFHLSQEEARLLRHNYVGTEHLLLGLLYQGEGMACEALESLHISREEVRGQVEEIIGYGESPTRPGQVPVTPRLKKVLELALREVMRLGHHQIGTEHMLLGLLREGEGLAVQVLVRLGADLPDVRERVVAIMRSRDKAGWPTRAGTQDGGLKLVDVAERLAEARRQKEAAFDAGDLDAAAAFRDRERGLLAEQARLEHELTAGGDIAALVAENHRLHGDVGRLRDLLRQHGIEPDGGSARSA
jgi:ATP-dependent Clp protease ATP-binding subunit ClpA